MYSWLLRSAQPDSLITTHRPWIDLKKEGRKEVSLPSVRFKFQPEWWVRPTGPLLIPMTLAVAVQGGEDDGQDDLRIIAHQSQNATNTSNKKKLISTHYVHSNNHTQKQGRCRQTDVSHFWYAILTSHCSSRRVRVPPPMGRKEMKKADNEISLTLLRTYLTGWFAILSWQPCTRCQKSSYRIRVARTWKCEQLMQRPSCWKRGIITFWNSAGSITSNIWRKKKCSPMEVKD